MPLRRFTLMSLVVAFLSPLAAAEEPAPLGHRDFYPTSDRPVGYRGDGNGYFPGADPVAVFSEGTPVEREVVLKDNRGRDQSVTVLDFADDKPRNIVWKTAMPSWANSQPIVVGDKVFTIGEPDWLICTDARTGRILWSRSNSVFAAMMPDRKLAARLYTMFEVYLAVDGFTDGQFTDRTPRWSPVQYRPMRDLFVKHSLPRILTALATADPDTDYRGPSEKMIESIDLFLADGGNYGKVKSALGQRGSFKDVLKGRIEKLAGQKVNIDMPWGNMVGWCMSVPVSDGTYVYASFGQGHTVCYDLEGNLVWQSFVQRPEGRTDTIQSPLLAGDVLVDMHGGAAQLRGLDKKTGKVLWTAPTRSDKAGKAKGGYYVGGHKVLRLSDGKTSMDVIVTSLCNIIRARDGKVVGHLPWEWNYGPSGGPSVFSSGTIVFRASNGDGGGSPFTAYRLTLVGEDQVRAEQIYALGKKGSPGYHGQVATPEVVIMTSSEGNVIDPATGKVLRSGDRRGRIGDMSNILAGKTLLWCDEGSRDRLMSRWGGRRDSDGKTALRFYAADVSNPAQPRRLDDRNLLGGENVPHYPPLETYLKELYDARALWGSWNGLPAHFMHVDTGMYPQGNRLFIRSVSHLYCIGDPDQPWHTPAGAPPEARTGK